LGAVAQQGDRLKNPFIKHSRGGRVPLLSRERVSNKQVQILPSFFDRRSKMYLREFKQNSILQRHLFPRFLTTDQQFTILIDGYRLNCMEILGYGRFGIVFKADIEGLDLQVRCGGWVGVS
jgi:hypothetical protein